MTKQQHAAATMEGRGTSNTGNIEARVVGAELVGLDIRPEWRRTVEGTELERELREAINAALTAYTKVFVEAVQSDTSVPDQLSRDLHEIAADTPVPALARSLDELADVIEELEQNGVPVDSGTATPPQPVIVDPPSGGVTVRVDNGAITQLSLNDLWLAGVDDTTLAAAVCETVTQAIWTYLAERLEAQASASGGADGLFSALYERQVYATSSLEMHLNRSDHAV